MNTRTLSLVALFTSLIIASDLALANLPNFKLEDTIVFASAYAFGWKVGIYVAIASELIWGIISPYGFGGPIIPFLVAGEIVYALAGALASKIWKVELNYRSSSNIFLGALLAICAFAFDIETNIGTSIIALGHFSLFGAITTIAFGAVFMIVHEVSDFALGAFLAPLVIAYFLRTLSDRPIESKQTLPSIKHQGDVI